MKLIKLENWMLSPRSGYCMLKPEEEIISVGGEVYGHSHFCNGEWVYTSNVVAVDIDYEVDPEGQMVVTTKSGTHYYLGEVHQEYKRLYPDVHHRLFARFNNVYQKLYPNIASQLITRFKGAKE